MTRKLTITYGRVEILPNLINVEFKFDNGEIEGCIPASDWGWFKENILFKGNDLIRESSGGKIVIIDEQEPDDE